MKRLALCLLIFPALMLAAAKERDWKTGEVAADSSITTVEYPGGGTQPRHLAEDSYVLVIRGDDFIYTAEERHAWDSWCLLFQGEEIHYSQDNRKLYVTDADGSKCRLDILKQEKAPLP